MSIHGEDAGEASQPVFARKVVSAAKFLPGNANLPMWRRYPHYPRQREIGVPRPAQSSKMLVVRAGGSQAKGSGAAISSTEWEQIGDEIHVWHAALDRERMFCANWSRHFRWKRKPGRIDFILRTTGIDLSWRAACFANCLAGIFIKLRPAWSFPMGSTESPLSRAKTLRVDFVSICRTRQAWSCTRLQGNEILGLTWSMSGPIPRATILPALFFGPRGERSANVAAGSKSRGIFSLLDAEGSLFESHRNGIADPSRQFCREPFARKPRAVPRWRGGVLAFGRLPSGRRLCCGVVV